jgi:hypothetical protein
VNDSYYSIVVTAPSHRSSGSVPKNNGFLKQFLFDTTLVPVNMDDTGDGTLERMGDYKNVLVVHQGDNTHTTDSKNNRSWRTKEHREILSFHKNGWESTVHEVIETGLHAVVRTKVVIRGYTTNDDAEYTHTMEEEKRSPALDRSVTTFTWVQLHDKNVKWLEMTIWCIGCCDTSSHMRQPR